MQRAPWKKQIKMPTVFQWLTYIRFLWRSSGYRLPAGLVGGEVFSFASSKYIITTVLLSVFFKWRRTINPSSASWQGSTRWPPLCSSSSPRREGWFNIYPHSWMEHDLREGSLLGEEGRDGSTSTPLTVAPPRGRKKETFCTCIGSFKPMAALIFESSTNSKEARNII